MTATSTDNEQSVADLVPPDRLPFIRGVDGLRAIAVMAVLFYHAEFGWALGGFLGVEMFLVISGYLITSLLLVEWLRTGRIDFRTFWLRRARRLLPAVGLLLVVVTTVSFLFYRDTVGRLVGEIVAAAGYVTNWLLIFRNVSYFESFERPSLLQHLWSLSVEEQFYVLWPVLFAVGLGVLRFKNKKTTIRAFFGITVAGVIASTVLMAMLFTPFSDPSRVYYGTDTRMAGLLVGVSLALVWIPWRLKPAESRTGRFSINAVGAAALVALLVLLVRVDEFSPLLYRGGFLVTSLATAGLIGVVVHPSGKLGALLDNRVMNWIGTRSYGIYLWHWPIFMLTRPGFEVADAPVAVFVVRTAATFAFAELSYRLVEMPIRKLGFKGWIDSIAAATRPRSVRSLVAGSTLLAALLVLSIGPQVINGSASVGVPDAISASSELTPVAVSQQSRMTSETVDTTTNQPLAGGDSASESRAEPAEVDAGDVAPGDTAPSTTEAPVATPDIDPPLDDPASQVNPDDPTALSRLLEPLEPSNLSVTLIGDSILAGSANAVLETFTNPVTIDATVSRQFKQAADVAYKLADEHALGDVVIIHLGTNGAFSSATFDAVMEAVSSAKRVVVLTTAVPRRWEDSVNDAIHAGAKRWPKIEILDWQVIAESHADWFKDDRVHLNATGQKAYAELLAATVNG